MEPTNLGVTVEKFPKFMAHSAVWGHPAIQRRNTNSKKLTIEKFSKSGLQEVYKVWSSPFKRCTKNHTFMDFAFYIGFPDLIWVTSSARNIDLVRKRNLGPK